MKDRRNDDGYETCSSSSNGSCGGSVADQRPDDFDGGCCVDGDDHDDVRSWLLRGVQVEMPDDFDALCANAPDWIDPDRLRRGRRFAADNYCGVSFSEALSLYLLFAFSSDGLDTLIATRRSDTPYRAYRRYYETSAIVRSWLQTDILAAGSEGRENLRKVFRMHRRAQDNSSRRSNGGEEGCGMATGCGASAGIESPWCTSLPDLREDFARAGAGQAPVLPERTDDRRGTSFNQSYMSVTLFGFFGLAVTYPERFGIHGASRRDMEDFVHLWRTVGYYMGVRDEYNFGRGTLDDVARRSRALLRELIVPSLRDVDAKWEHMSRCAAEGIRMYMRSAMPFESSLCYLCDVLGVDAVNFRKSLGLWQRLRVWCTGLLMRVAMRYECVRRGMNRAVFARLSRAAREFGDERAQAELKSTVFGYENGV